MMSRVWILLLAIMGLVIHPVSALAHNSTSEYPLTENDTRRAESTLQLQIPDNSVSQDDLHHPQARESDEIPCHQALEDDKDKGCDKCRTGACDSDCCSASHCLASCMASVAASIVNSNSVDLASCVFCNSPITISSIILTPSPSRIFHPPKAG
jgi:hypothetical protein